MSFSSCLFRSPRYSYQYFRQYSTTYTDRKAAAISPDGRTVTKSQASIPIVLAIVLNDDATNGSHASRPRLVPTAGNSVLVTLDRFTQG